MQSINRRTFIVRGGILVTTLSVLSRRGKNAQSGEHIRARFGRGRQSAVHAFKLLRIVLKTDQSGKCAACGTECVRFDHDW
jgi:hypothetical protein